MNLRRSLTFLVLALTLLAPATAQADKAKPKGTTPKLFVTLTDGAMNKTISPTVTTTFAPPKGTTAAAACKGKVTTSVPVGKKTVKKKKKTIYVTKKSSLRTSVAGVCTATAVLKISESFLGKTLKFSAKFKGNDAVKKFTKSSKFKLVVAAPPLVPAPSVFVPTLGPWVIKQTPFVAGDSLSWSMTIGAGGAVASIQRFSSVTMTCQGAPLQVNVDIAKAQFDTPFAITKTDVTATDEWSAGGASPSERTTSTFKLHFDSAGHATGTFRMTGGLFGQNPAGSALTFYPDCDSGSLPIELTPGAFA